MNFNVIVNGMGSSFDRQTPCGLRERLLAHWKRVHHSQE